MDLDSIQKALRDRNIDAWLFCDHHHRDPIAYRVLGLPNGLMVTRRWFYLIPAKGEPTKLVHKIEAGHLDTLPGTKLVYAGWQELFDKMKAFWPRIAILRCSIRQIIWCLPSRWWMRDGGSDSWAGKECR